MNRILAAMSSWGKLEAPMALAADCRRITSKPEGTNNFLFAPFSVNPAVGKRHSSTLAFRISG